jgi:hypothetical protein
MMLAWVLYVPKYSMRKNILKHGSPAYGSARPDSLEQEDEATRCKHSTRSPFFFPCRALVCT